MLFPKGQEFINYGVIKVLSIEFYFRKEVMEETYAKTLQGYKFPHLIYD